MKLSQNEIDALKTAERVLRLRLQEAASNVSTLAMDTSLSPHQLAGVVALVSWELDLAKAVYVLDRCHAELSDPSDPPPSPPTPGTPTPGTPSNVVPLRPPGPR